MTTRRELLLTAAAAAASASAASAGDAAIPADLIRRHDEAVDRYLAQQVTAAGRWQGAIPDSTGLHGPGAMGGLLATLGTAFLYEGSRHHGSKDVLARMRLGAGYLDRSLSPEGNIDLLVTNFNSPPDTGFMVHGMVPLLKLARERKSAEVVALMEPLLSRCGHGLATGGVHTPNHRWVVCSALAQLYEVMPKPEYLRRIDEWLAEGIDIDSDGQYTERSTSVYNPVVDRALVVVAHKLNRPELLDPVRKNLDALLYLTHPNGEVVTEISRRQDLNQRGTMFSYWFPLQYLAVRDNNGQYAALAAMAAPHAASLPVLLEYPELAKQVTPAALPSDFEKSYPGLGITRIRRGGTSATLILAGSSRFLTLRRGDAVVTAVRFASAFFGKGQFIPARAGKQDGGFSFDQELSAGYFQPLDKPFHVAAGEWGSTRPGRRQTEICRLRQSARVVEEKDGFSVHIQAGGTRDVPLAIEIAFADGGKLEGCDAVHGEPSAFLMRDRMASYRVGADTIRFGPLLREHAYVSVRGAEPRIPGQQTVYLTALTPVDHTLRFTWA